MKYRSDIDGLRAIAVISVIAFHTGIQSLSGGYVGVDVFFVISGYLITTLIFKEMKDGDFTFRNFYKRRASRLLPALSTTLFLVLVFGFIFYNTKNFDNLGKELFFSAFGAANILFAQGINYFAKNESYQPLIHLWSLGVEEQFYIIWPIILLLAFKFSKKTILPIAFFFFSFSLFLSIIAVENKLTKGYFLLHYRAFELLIGVITALLLQRKYEFNLSDTYKRFLSIIAMLLIAIPMITLDKHSDFPGYNALWPCLGSAIIIAFPNNGAICKFLSHKILVYIGLISYPLYLFHQPIISFFYFFNIQLHQITFFISVTLISIILSWITYRYIEGPIRRYINSPNKRFSNLALLILLSTIPVFAITGAIIAKSGGLEARFKYLNPFALKVTQAHSTTFHQHFKRGFQVKNTKHSKALFIGDSVLQHYVLPIKIAKKFELDEIDTVTRGGCVLLKGVLFNDKIADISCDDIRGKLYKNKKTYDYVIISQAWDSYEFSVLNFPERSNTINKWESLLNQTIEHFLKISNEVIIIGSHLKVDGTLNLQPSITITQENLLSDLKYLKISNLNQLEQSRNFFSKYKENPNISVIEPYSIFCKKQCILSNNIWSYFSDNQHLSAASTTFVAESINQELKSIH